MGGTLWIGNLALQPMIAEPWWRGIALLILIALAAISYFGTGQWIGAFKLGEFKRALKRG